MDWTTGLLPIAGPLLVKIPIRFNELFQSVVVN